MKGCEWPMLNLTPPPPFCSINEANASDGHALGPTEVYNYLSKLMYARRTKMNPLWNTLLVGGVRKGERFLGYVDLIGTTYTASTLATGYGAYMCAPLS
jgi:20S proteasome subunit beta 7